MTTRETILPLSTAGAPQRRRACVFGPGSAAVLLIQR